MTSYRAEVEQGSRFEFGANWARFLNLLTPQRIRLAEVSLLEMLSTTDLCGKRFLDIGSGSGLFSLAARRLGASVHSFDYDPMSVTCTKELRRRYCPDDPEWVVDEGSVLDEAYLSRLGEFDIVYSWGVLHHTGAMWDALANVAPLVAPSGKLFIALYNDQGAQSRRWRTIKRIYNKLPRFIRPLFFLTVVGAREMRFLVGAALRGQPWSYFDNVIHYSERSLRGMSYWYDLFDWIGGYPFEVAKPEEVFRFYRDRGFQLLELTTCGGGLGCNEFVFERSNIHSR